MGDIDRNQQAFGPRADTQLVTDDLQGYRCVPSMLRDGFMPVSTSVSADPLALTGEIVAAFVANNSLPLSELPALI